MARKNQGVEANELGNDPIDEVIDERPADTNPSQPEDTSQVKADVAAATREAERDLADAASLEANAPDQETGPEPGQPQPFTGGDVELPLGLSVADIIWWNNSQNRNYMAGDGPQAGITEATGTAQSASSVDPQVRLETLRDSLRAEEEAQANADNGNNTPDQE